MNRKITWGIAAAYPALAMIYSATAGGEAETPILWPRTSFWVEYWWAILGGTIVVVLLFFLAHALLNRRLSMATRLIWAVAILLAGPVTVFLYWWANSGSQSNLALNNDVMKP